MAVAGLLGGCAAPAAHGASAADQQQESDTPEQGLDAALFYQLLLAEIQLRQSDPGAAYSLMLDAARRTQSPELFRRAVEIALQGRSGNAALAAAQEWSQSFPDADEAYRYELQILLSLNRTAETGRTLAQLLRLTPAERQNEVISAIPQVLARAGDPVAALQAARSALQLALLDPATAGAAWAALGRMELQRRALPAALEAAQAGLRMQPDSVPAATLAVDLFERKVTDAEPLVLSFLDRAQSAATPQQRSMELAYIGALIDLRRFDHAQSRLERLLADTPELPEARLLLGLLQTRQRQLPAAEATLTRYLELLAPLPQAQARRGQAQAYLQLAEIAQLRQDYHGAHAWLERIENADNLFAVQVRRSTLLARQGKVAQARELLQLQPERSEAELRQKMFAQARLLREISAYQESLEVLTQAAQRLPRDPDIAYEQAMAAKKAGRVDLMESLLRQLMAQHPDYYHAYNALGYWLADNKLRLEEAQALIQRALALAPGNPYIIDSLGWVQFRLGHRAQALATLQDAYKRMPDAEVAAHLGEVHWSLGQREQALTVWRAGLRMEPDNRTLLQTLQRLDARP